MVAKDAASLCEKDKVNFYQDLPNFKKIKFIA